MKISLLPLLILFFSSSLLANTTNVKVTQISAKQAIQDIFPEQLPLLAIGNSAILTNSKEWNLSKPKGEMVLYFQNGQQITNSRTLNEESFCSIKIMSYSTNIHFPKGDVNVKSVYFGTSDKFPARNYTEMYLEESSAEISKLVCYSKKGNTGVSISQALLSLGDVFQLNGHTNIGQANFPFEASNPGVTANGDARVYMSKKPSLEVVSDILIPAKTNELFIQGGKVYHPSEKSKLDDKAFCLMKVDSSNHLRLIAKEYFFNIKSSYKYQSSGSFKFRNFFDFYIHQDKIVITKVYCYSPRKKSKMTSNDFLEVFNGILAPR